MLKKVRLATANDVAAAAGVSRSAVSRAFTPGASVAASTRDRIIAAAAELRYKPNAIARMLIRQESRIVAIVLGDFGNVFLSTVLGRLVDALKQEGYLVTLFKAGDRRGMDDILESILQYRVASIIVTGLTPSSAAVETCAQQDTPVIILNRAPRELGSSLLIGTDHERGGTLAAEILLSAGHRRFAFVASDQSMSTHEARRRGYLSALQAAGFPCSVRTLELSHGGGFAAATDLLNSTDAPDAIFCSADIMAVGALDAARQLGRDVPDCVAILGFNDDPMASWSAYDLSTIRQPVEEMVSATVAELTGLREQPFVPGRAILFPPEFIPRRTTRPV